MSQQGIDRRGLMLVLSSPSGAGKTTISRLLLARDDALTMSVSATTRPMRPGEVEGRDYYFVDPTEFNLMVNRQELLEHAKVFDNYYGTPRDPVETSMREGKDITIVAIGRMALFAAKAAEALAEEGIDCEVVDPRTTSPLDSEAILASVRKTGRLIVVDEAYPRCNMATDIAALAAQEAFRDLRAAPRMVSPPHTSVPFGGPLEDAYVPGPDRIADAVRAAMTDK
ncbi:MAG: hypothetical protein HOK81_09880 [Rhodospirillaceae bacterium]|nr:hypothetical protein [Rhodospirillaceae bacterium]